MEEQNNAQPIVEVTVELDREAHRRFSWFSWFHWPKSIATLIFVFLLQPTALAIILIAAFSKPGAALAGAASGCSAVFLYCIMLILTHHRRAFRKIEKQCPTPNTFTFFDSHVETRGGTQFAQGTEQMQYELFVKVYETAHAFYLVLRVPKDTAFLLDKKFCDAGQAAALRELFARKLQAKFIRKCDNYGRES